MRRPSPRALPVAVLLLAATAHADSPEPFAPSLHAAAGAAIDRAALSAELGGRWAPLPRIGLGVDLELNPWIDLLSGAIAPGVLSLLGSGFYRWTQVERVELRTTVHLGASLLLFNAVGAPAGSLGAYLGLGALSALVQVAPHAWLEFKPDVVVSIPHLHGTPFVYRQYRMTVGLEWRP